MGTMKTVEKIVNPRERAGEKSPGKIYTDKLKVRRRREWRGLKDTFYDYTRWLYLMSVLGRFIMVPRNIKGFLRYRWMMSYLFVPHGMDKFTVGLRDEALRISHTAMNYVIADVTQAIHNCFRGDRRVGNDVKYFNECVLTDENSMVTFMMGFDKKEVHTILREVPTMFASNIFHQSNEIRTLCRLATGSGFLFLLTTSNNRFCTFDSKTLLRYDGTIKRRRAFSCDTKSKSKSTTMNGS